MQKSVPVHNPVEVKGSIMNISASLGLMR